MNALRGDLEVLHIMHTGTQVRTFQVEITGKTVLLNHDFQK